MSRHSESQAKSKLQSIIEMVKAVNDAGDDNAYQDARGDICNSPHTVEVRSGWHSPGSYNANMRPAKYNILLCTGGPGCRITGELNEQGNPTTAVIQHQDWRTPWIDYYLITMEEKEALLCYVRYIDLAYNLGANLERYGSLTTSGVEVS